MSLLDCLCSTWCSCLRCNRRLSVKKERKVSNLTHSIKALYLLPSDQHSCQRLAATRMSLSISSKQPSLRLQNFVCLPVCALQTERLVSCSAVKEPSLRLYNTICQHACILHAERPNSFVEVQRTISASPADDLPACMHACTPQSEHPNYCSAVKPPLVADKLAAMS